MRSKSLFLDYQALAIWRTHQGAPLAPTCFHAQQWVEKTLKSVLMASRVHSRRTHDLDEITSLLERAHVTPIFALDLYPNLGPFAAELRYDELLMPSNTIETVDHMARRTFNWALEQVREEPQAVG